MMPTPKGLELNRGNIPKELIKLDQWVGWNWKRIGEKWTKVPYDLKTGANASSDDPATWSPYSATQGHENIGFMFSADDPFCGVDLDGCRNSETWEISAETQGIIKRLGSYAEISPSGTGVKVFLRGSIPGPRRKNPKKNIEVYDRLRFFTVTGHQLPGTPPDIRGDQETIDRLYDWLFPQVEVSTGPSTNGLSPNHDLSDEDILSRAYRAANGEKFMRLWNGTSSEYESHSEADLALCSMLAFWTGPDPERIERMFSGSGLARGKWADRPAYRKKTVTKALSDMTEFYSAQSGATVVLKNEKPASAVEVASKESAKTHRWPVLGEDAYHGLTGQLVRAMEPHSEADPVAILIHLLSGFGNAVGRSPYVRVGAGRHHAKLNAALVGETAKARKGMSWTYAEDVLGSADRYWAQERVMNGLSSGEGLIYQVRDRVEGTNKEGDPYVVDEGAEDKRLFVLEEEFASVLKVATREGNTLSAIIRTAWDSGRLSTLTKNNPLKASDSHVSIVGHVTKTELVKLLSESDAHNGFANRFLWICVRRSKALPFGGDWYGVDSSAMVRELSEALHFAKNMGEIRWGNTAKPLWMERYEGLSEGFPGLFGAVTSRAEAQTLRLALVYALIDSSHFIEEEHLRSALAVWQYAEDSARFVFGDTTGDPVADG